MRLFFFFPVGILLCISHHRVLSNQSTDGPYEVCFVLGHLSTDLLRRAISGPRRRRRDERAERRVPSAGDVSAVPPLLRVLRQL